MNVILFVQNPVLKTIELYVNVSSLLLIQIIGHLMTFNNYLDYWQFTFGSILIVNFFLSPISILDSTKKGMKITLLHKPKEITKILCKRVHTDLPKTTKTASDYHK